MADDVERDVDSDVDAPDAESDDAPTADEIAEELDALGKAEAERDEYLDALRRVQADFENYRKRMLREQTSMAERAGEQLVEQLLPVLDNFELALDSIPADDDEIGKVRKGVELVYADLLGVLEKAGLSRIEALGKPFDPNEHEAVAQEEGGDGEPIVSDVLRTGYRLKGRVVRPATVRVKR